MNNATFHFSGQIERLPYTPIQNFIDENFGLLKTISRSKHKEQVGLRKRDFIDYVKAYIAAFKDRGDIAEGH